MLAEWSDIQVTPGSRQCDRLPAALAEGFWAIDDRDLAARLVLLGDLARHIAFVDAEGRIAGTWRKLFEAEPAFVLAQLAILDPARALAAFEIQLAQDWHEAELMVAAFARQVSGWLVRLSRLHDTPMAVHIERLRSRDDFVDKLTIIGAEGQAAASGRRAAFADALALAGVGGLDIKGVGGPDPVAEARAEYEVLRAAMTFVLNTAAALQPVAARDLEARLRSGGIDPALGLLLAELRALDAVGAQINHLPERLVQFYYRDVLAQAPRPAPPERVVLTFPAPTIPVLLPAQSVIVARADARTWRFVTDAQVQMIPAQITAQAILRYDVDQRVALSASLGGISGIRAEYQADMADLPARRLFAPGAKSDSATGLEIGSPLLWLAEGARQIEVDLELVRRVPWPEAADLATLVATLRTDPQLLAALGYLDPEDGAHAIAERVIDAALAEGRAVSVDLLHEVLARAPLPLGALQLVLGRIVARVLLEGQPWPKGAFLEVLGLRVAEAGPALGGQSGQETAQSMMAEVFRLGGSDAGFVYTPDDAFEMLLGDAFALELSTAAGCFAPGVFRVRRTVSETGRGIGFQIKLERADPAITAPAGGTAPFLRVLAAPMARIFPQSFLELYRVDRVRVKVRADDMQGLVGFGDDGRLDLGQSFMPFGIRPRDGASMSVLAPEMALKPVSDISLTLEWAELPGHGAGFERHYAQYGGLVRFPSPKMKVEFRGADGWKPLAAGDVDMIAVDAATTAMRPAWRFDGSLRTRAIPDSAAHIPQTPASRDQIRAGAVRLTLTDSLRGFLAEEYPAALVRALRPRLFSRLRPKFLTTLKQYRARARRHLPKVPSLPMTPFVPKITTLRLGYSAQTVMSLNAPDQARAGEYLAHVTPFGRRRVYPQSRQSAVGLFADRLGFGARFFQLSGDGALGPVSLLFEIMQARTQAPMRAPRPIAWYYLGPDGWMRLPDTALASDTTDGLTRTGIVMVHLPDDAVARSEEMPGQGYWLGAVADWPDLDGYPILTRVQTNAVGATTIAQPETPAKDTPRSFALSPSVAGLGQPSEVAIDRLIQQDETDADFKARVSAQLRHRGQAITPDDVEALVLAAFPDVWMVKCLCGMDCEGDRTRPGAVCVVVVPHPPGMARAGAPQTPRPQLFDPGMLRNIEAFLAARMPIGASVSVRNPSYEILQLRGTVRFDALGDNGARALRLRQDMAQALSVWTAAPDLGRFGWSLNVESLRAEIERLPYVDVISGFSVLQLVCDHTGSYHLFDTATADFRAPASPVPAGAGGEARPRLRNGSVRLSAAEPWGLPLSAPDHVFHAATDLRHRDARPAGIGALRVGEMLIIKKRASL